MKASIIRAVSTKIKMSELSSNDAQLCKKVSSVLTILSERTGSLSDDTYTEKLVSEFGRKLGQLRQDLRFLFWVESGALNFLRNLALSESSNFEIENFGLKFLSRCVEADARICDEAAELLSAFVR